ncbi:MAG: ABC transporter ATP-binding protein [Thermoleophilia bacterium]
MGTALKTNSAGALAAPALCFRDVSLSYRDDRRPALCGVDLELAPGELLTVVGGNGSGKSTLARLCNGLLVPGQGEVVVGGLSTADEESAWTVRSLVGLLFQNPEDQIVGASVEDDVAFGLENLGTAREEMRARVSEALAAVGLSGEERTEPHLLSGGQKQRLALAGVLVLEPSVLVLDEPTSMLDPSGRDDVMTSIRRLIERGVAIVLITQRMDEAVAGDRLMALVDGRVGYLGSPRGFFVPGVSDTFPLGVPPALALAREVLDYGPDLPLTEDELVDCLRQVRPSAAGAALRATAGRTAEADAPSPASLSVAHGADAAAAPAAVLAPSGASAVSLRGVSLTYNRGTFLQRSALGRIDVTILAGVVTAVVGATASGKSTLLQLAAGLLRPDSGHAEYFGAKRPDPGKIGMVFQRAETQLFKNTVWEDVAVAPRLRGLSGADLERRVAAALQTVGLDPGRFGGRSPHALSLGEQRRVALAGVISLDPLLLVLDEPGAGLDPLARERLMTRLVEWVGETTQQSDAAEGLSGEIRAARSLLFSSHDIDEVARRADRVIVLDRGAIVADGPVAEVLSDVSMLEAARLQPPLATRVARRLGASSRRGPIDSPGFVSWFRAGGRPT